MDNIENNFLSNTSSKALDELERLEKIELDFSIKSAKFEEIEGKATLYLSTQPEKAN